jgi:hypothetical protein
LPGGKKKGAIASFNFHRKGWTMVKIRPIIALVFPQDAFLYQVICDRANVA